MPRTSLNDRALDVPVALRRLLLDGSYMDYLDFELEIQPGIGRDYPIAVLRSPAGEARATMHFPFDAIALESRLKDLQIALLRSGGTRRSALSPEERAVRDFGQALFDAIFTGEIRARYDISCERAAQKEQGVRLKLAIQAPELAALPWELLYDPRQGEYLCLSRNTPIVRYLQLQQPIRSLKVNPPLRILAMIASPRDQAALDTTREKQRLERAVAHLQARGLVDLTWLEGQTWHDLQRAMRGGPWHVFHFVGHGAYDSHLDEGLIVLSADDGRSEYMSATQFARLLANHRSLRLVMLNACEGAKGGRLDVFSSTASILVRRNIPAVIAMQYEITDWAAIEFGRAFYEALADGLPVDAAASEARTAVSMQVMNTIEWGTPVLYMRAPDGVLFDMATPSAQSRSVPLPPEETEQASGAAESPVAPTSAPIGSTPVRAEPPTQAAAHAEPPAPAAIASTETRTRPESSPIVAQPVVTMRPAAKHRGWLRFRRPRPVLLALLGGLAVLVVAVLWTAWLKERASSATASMMETRRAETAGAAATTEPLLAASAPGETRTSPPVTIAAAIPTEELAVAFAAEPTVTDTKTPSSTSTPSPTKARTATATRTLTKTYAPTATPTPTVTLPLQAGATMISPVDGMVMVWVPSGGFTMGSADTDSLASDNEKPQDKVYVEGFWISRTEVTNGQYSRCVQVGQCTAPDNQEYTSSELANRPVANVSWPQAADYARWVGGRLPTEAEWEKACRGTDARIYPWGNAAPTDKLAGYSGRGGGTADVGSYPAGASPYGLLDMAGNVWEWTSSGNRAYPYRAGDGREGGGAVARVVRGGAYGNVAGNLRCAARVFDEPLSSHGSIGFRVIASPSHP